MLRRAALLCCAVLCSGQEVNSEQTVALQALLEGSLLCNDSALSKDETTGHYTPNGAPTEVSLITAALKAGLQPSALKQAKPRVASVPFESEHKVSSHTQRAACLAALPPFWKLGSCHFARSAHAPELGLLFRTDCKSPASVAGHHPAAADCALPCCRTACSSWPLSTSTAHPALTAQQGVG